MTLSAAAEPADAVRRRGPPSVIETVSVPRFDEHLDRVLAAQAASSGQTINEYIAQAVAQRLVADVAERDQPELGPLRERLASLGMTPSRPPVDPAAAVLAILRHPDRLNAVQRTGLLDSPREEAYDRIVRMAREALAVPAAAITVIDDHRQFIKSAVGFGNEEVRETPIERSICQYTIASGEPLFVEDARVHPLLSANPVVVEKLLVAYAGVPVADQDGYFVGTLCVWDDKPREWTTGHIRILTDLAGMLGERISGVPDS
jgi:hypothetical protein